MATATRRSWLKTRHQNTHVFLFNQGLQQMVEALAPHYPRCYTERGSSDAGWVGRSVPNVETLKRYCREPWAEGVLVVAEMLARLRKVKLPVPASVRRRPSYSYDGGDDVDLDRLRSGQEFWRRAVRQETHGSRIITVFTEITTSACHKWRDILWRGAAALALTELLEKQGYTVELWAYQHVSGGYQSGTDLFSAACLKRTGQPLNIGATVTGLSGWFYRTAFFASYYLACPEDGEEPEYGLGYPQHYLPQWARQLITPDREPVILTDVWSFDQAVDMATRWLEHAVLKKPHADLQLLIDGTARYHYR